MNRIENTQLVCEKSVHVTDKSLRIQINVRTVSERD